jgi:putative addiction module killer protein
MMYEIRTTDTFENWLKALKDRKVVLSMAKRLDRAMKGNLGDVEAVGDGVSEMRIYFGPGYRFYFTMQNGNLIVLLRGGDKSSQQRDIQNAKELAGNL